jgi:ribosomal protein L29
VQLQLRTLSQSASNLDLKLAAITSDNLTSDTVDAREAKLTALKNEYTALRTQLESLKASVAGNPAFVTKVDVTIAGVDTALAVIETDFTNIRQFKAALQSI